MLPQLNHFGLLAIKRGSTEVPFMQNTGNTCGIAKRARAKNSIKAKLQDCPKRSMGAQCLHVVTAGYCDLNILQVCDYFGGSSLSLLAVQALWDLCNMAIVFGK